MEASLNISKGNLTSFLLGWAPKDSGAQEAVRATCQSKGQDTGLTGR